MNDTIREQLSALADGELGGEGGRFLLKRLDHDQQVRSVWERYHLIRDCLRERSIHLAPADFCARVADAIAADQVAAVPAIAMTARTVASGTRRTGSWRAAMGVAIAASVSALALFSTRVGEEAAGQLPGGANVSQLAPLTTSDLVPAWRIPGVAETQRYLLIPAPPANDLDTYFLRHGEASSDLGPLGLVSPVRAVAATAGSEVVDGRGQE
ncbi:MAG: sigma-E factor negative regulatory protein [Lysobacterales bacterium]